MRRFLIPVAAGLLLAGCRDQAPDVDQSVVTGPQFANSAPIPGFNFLPPLAPKQTNTGTFNGGLFPLVEICKLTGAPGANGGACSADALIGTYTRTGGTKNTLIFVVSNSHYGVDWKTGDYGIPNGTYARITVGLPGGTPAPSGITLDPSRPCPGDAAPGCVFGFADVYIDRDSKKLADAPLYGAVGVRNGGTLNIKFRLEEGVLCENDTHCVEGTVDSNGGTFVFDDATGGMEVPQGFITQGSANLVIERYSGPELCLPTNNPQYPDCIRVRAIGDYQIDETKLVLVGFCLDAPNVELEELEVWKWNDTDGDYENPVTEEDATPSNPATLTRLVTANVDHFITGCGSLASAEQSALKRLASNARTLLKPIASIFGPTPAFAASTAALTTCPFPCPFGAGMSDFSRIGTVRPLTLTPEALPLKTLAGVTLDPAVVVTNKLGLPVTFLDFFFTKDAPTAGALPPTTTDASGRATTSWLIEGGVNVLRAHPHVPQPPGFATWKPKHLFTVTGIDPATLVAIFLPPVGKNSGDPTKFVAGVPGVTVRICRLVDSDSDGIVDACGSETYGPLTAVDDGSSKYQANWNSPSDLVIGGVYRVTVWVGTYERNFIDIQPLAGGKAKNLTEGTEFNFQVGSTLPFKFSLETP